MSVAGLTRAAGKTDPRSRWVNALRQRRGFNKACVAIANKNARIAWALLAKDEDYRRAAYRCPRAFSVMATARNSELKVLGPTCRQTVA